MENLTFLKEAKKLYDFAASCDENYTFVMSWFSYSDSPSAEEELIDEAIEAYLDGDADGLSNEYTATVPSILAIYCQETGSSFAKVSTFLDSMITEIAKMIELEEA